MNRCSTPTSWLMASHLAGSRISYPEWENILNCKWVIKELQGLRLIFTRNEDKQMSKWDVPGKLDVQRVTRGSRIAAVACCLPPMITIINRFLNVDYIICLNGCQNKVYISIFFRTIWTKNIQGLQDISWSVGFQIRQAWCTNPPPLPPDGPWWTDQTTDGHSKQLSPDRVLLVAILRILHTASQWVY